MPKTSKLVHKLVRKEMRGHLHSRQGTLCRYNGNIWRAPVVSRLSTLSRCLLSWGRHRYADAVPALACRPGSGDFPFADGGNMRIAAQRGVDAITQYLTGILYSYHARIERGADIVQQMMRHLVDLSLIALDLFRTVGVPPGAHAGFGIGLRTGEVLGNANIPGQANHRIDRLVSSLYIRKPRGIFPHRLGDISKLPWRRRQIKLPDASDADGIVKAMVNIVIGAHRMRQRVDNAQEAAHECIRSRVLRPDHIHHRIVAFWCC